MMTIYSQKHKAPSMNVGQKTGMMKASADIAAEDTVDSSSGFMQEYQLLCCIYE